MKRNIILTAVLLAVVISVTGCAKKGAWLTDYEEAKKIAAKQNKNMIVFFSGDDWDEKSAALKENITNKPEFIKAAKKDYVLVNIDFSQDIYQKVLSFDEETATDADKKEYDRINAEYEAKAEIARQYNLASYPTLYVATAEGQVVTLYEYYEEVDSLDSMIGRLERLKEKVEEINTLSENVKKATGIERVKAIDALYEATAASYRITLNDLIREIPELDKNNETGLLGKYEIQICYLDAIELASTQDVEGASKVFEIAAENGHLDLEQKQEAYYTGAYILTSAAEFNYPRMIELLQKAFDVNPEGSHANDILETLNAIKDLQAKAEQQALEQGTQE